MPAAIAWVGAAIAAGAATGTAAAVVGGILMANATFIGYSLLIVSSVAMGLRAKRKAREQQNASQVDRLQSIMSTVSPRELVLGRVRKGGSVVFRDSTGADNAKFYMVVALASHKISGVEKYYLNDKEVTVDSNGYVQTAPYNVQSKTTETTTSVVPGSCYVVEVGPEGGATREVCQYYTSSGASSTVARIRIYDGSQTSADATLMAKFPGVWTANHKLLGVAYAIVELDYSESAFPSGIPSLTVVMKGAEVYDPRTGTTVFSENPALHARHVITHSRFGKRKTITAAEDARIVAAANACDTSYTPSGGTARSLYRSGIVIPYGTQASDALDDLCAASCGMWAYAGGEFFIKAGVYTAPVLTLQASDLLTTQKDSQGGSTTKAISINTHKARADKVNSITAKIYDADSQYKETTITAVKNAAAIAKDGQELPLEVSLTAVSSASQAQVVCNYMLKDSFDPLGLTANFKLTAYPLELFDNVALNIPRYGWTNKVFTVLGRNFDPTGTVQLTLRETSAELFNPLVYSNSAGYAINTDLREPWDIDDPGVLTLSSGTSELLLQGDGSLVTRIRVQWSSIIDARVRQGGHVELRWKDIYSDTWSTVTVPGVETSAYILGAVDRSTIVIMARTRTQVAVSDWNVQTTHLVLGKSEPPAGVTTASTSIIAQTLQIAWSPVLDVDLAGYELRLSDSGWGSTGEVYRGTSTTITLKLTGRTTSWYLKSYDRSGNYSASTKVVTFTKASVALPPSASVSAIDGKLILSWVAATPEFGVLAYEVRDSESGWGQAGETYRGQATSCEIVPNAAGVGKTWFIRTVDSFGDYSEVSLLKAYTKEAVKSVTNLSTGVSGQRLYLSWTEAVEPLGLSGYEVRQSDSDWGAPSPYYRGTELLIEIRPSTVTSTWYVKAFDRFGNYSTAATTLTYTAPAVAKVSEVGHVFADTSLTAATVTLSWADAIPTFGLDSYELTYNGSSLTVRANTVTVPANWIGNRNFSITTVDNFGFKSEALVYPVTKLIPASAINFRAQVIDNNVLLYWTVPSKTSLPIAHSLLKKGASWDTAEVIGTKDGEFTTVFELSGGEFTYWVSIIDTDGYESIPVQLTTAVTQPPDFLFLGELNSTFEATRVNAIKDSGTLVLPVNLTESFDGHFSSRGWASPDAQVSAGFPIFLQPGLGSGSYEEVFDFGTVVGSCSVTTTLAGVDVSGTTSKFITVSISDDLIDWTGYPGYTQIFATNFRYVRVKFEVAQNVVGDLYRLDQMTVRLDSKILKDSGTVSALASDVGGTPVNFNFEVLDVSSINTTVNATTSRIVVYDFLDSTKTGTYSIVSNVATISATAHGMKVGQNVRIAPTSGTLRRNVYTVLSVTGLDSYTVGVINPNTSGGCVTYPNSFTVYVFDNTGTRQSNLVSWNMTGS